MKLSECRIGTIVTENPEKASGVWRDRKPFAKIGTIVGLTMNACDNPEVIPMVQWARDSHRYSHFGDDFKWFDAESPKAVHHSNLDLYEG